jgi:hypothetical protein
MPDGAILPRRIHSLNNQQQRPTILRVKLLVHVVEALDSFFQELIRLFLEIQPSGIGGIVIF